jgi:SPP1 gp7 family putative phage head morphogenesis protein
MQGSLRHRAAPARTVPPLIHDAAHKKPVNYFQARRAETGYLKRLRGIARQVGHLVEGYYDGRDILSVSDVELRAVLKKYSDLIVPWARSAADLMLADVARRDKAGWAKVSREMGRQLHIEIESAPTGELFRELMQQQVVLITSLPIEAAQRVHNLVLQAQETSSRGEEIIAAIMRSGEVTEGRARTIARTETGRASSTLLQARATHIGSPGYIWRSMGDSDVRKLHRKLNGRFFAWSDPPISGESGERSHPGCIYNCRCFPDPVIPESL